MERAVSGGFEAPARLPAQAARPGSVTGPAPGSARRSGHAAVRLVASRDLVTVMTAPAGAGKTTTLAAAVHAWSRAGLEVTALAPSARAAAELSTATGAPGVTVARWLLTQAHLDTTPAGAARHRQPGRLSRRSVLVVDEASMLSTADLDALTAGPPRPAPPWSWSGTRRRSARSTPPAACSTTSPAPWPGRSSSWARTAPVHPGLGGQPATPAACADGDPSGAGRVRRPRPGAPPSRSADTAADGVLHLLAGLARAGRAGRGDAGPVLDRRHRVEHPGPGRRPSGRGGARAGAGHRHRPRPVHPRPPRTAGLPGRGRAGRQTQHPPPARRRFGRWPTRRSGRCHSARPGMG